MSGLYEFACTIASDGELVNLDAEIMVDNKQVARLHATLWGDDLGSQVTVVPCNKGQAVKVRHYGSGRDNAKIKSGFSTFSGHLIKAD